MDDLEDPRRADGLASATDDAKLPKRIDDLAQFVPALAHVPNDCRNVLLILVDFERYSVFGESLPPRTLA
jgi:hypothetical protein